MKRKLIGQIIVCLVALFLSGAICGYAVGGRVPLEKLREARPSPPAPRLEEAWLERHYRETVTRLQLTPEQAEKLRAHYGMLAAEIRAFHEETSNRLKVCFTRHNQAVVPDFTPEQREEYNKLLAERQAAARR